MQAREFPNAALLYILILLDAAGPVGVRAEAAEHRHLVPARLGGLAVDGQIDDRIEHHLGVQAARRQALPAIAETVQEIGGDRLAPARRVLAVDQLGPVGEQGRHLVPQAELRILRIGDLEPLDVAHPLRRDRHRGRAARRRAPDCRWPPAPSPTANPRRSTRGWPVPQGGRRISRCDGTRPSLPPSSPRRLDWRCLFVPDALIMQCTRGWAARSSAKNVAAKVQKGQYASVSDKAWRERSSAISQPPANGSRPREHRKHHRSAPPEPVRTSQLRSGDGDAHLRRQLHEPANPQHPAAADQGGIPPDRYRARHARRTRLRRGLFGARPAAGADCRPGEPAQPHRGGRWRCSARRRSCRAMSRISCSFWPPVSGPASARRGLPRRSAR